MNSTERRLDESTISGKQNSEDNDLARSPYARDRGRVIHSSAFRRLQDKTQVLCKFEGDYHRTRLTHSLEVGQIARSIAAKLILEKEGRAWSGLLETDYGDFDYLNLIETIALLHDIGHPPFGHGGEVALNYMMRKHQGFEGNGQTLRIASKLAKYNDAQNSQQYGMNLTRRVLLGIIKYPTNYSAVSQTRPAQLQDYSVGDNYYQLDEKICEPPKCFYDEELDIFKWIMSGVKKSEVEYFKSLAPIEINTCKYSKSMYKSFDCSIMELADDISYAVHDFEDFIELGLLNEKSDGWDKLLMYLNKNQLSKYCKEKYGFSTNQLDYDYIVANIKNFTSMVISFLISKITVTVSDKIFETAIFRFKACIKEQLALDIIKTMKDIVMCNVIKSPKNYQATTKGQYIISKIFDALANKPKLLPLSTFDKYQSGLQSQERVICDYISGMTDSYALNMFRRLFTPAEVSLFTN